MSEEDSGSPSHLTEEEEQQGEEQEDVRDTDADNVTHQDHLQSSRDNAELASQFAEFGQYKTAVMYYTKAIKHNPTDCRLYGDRSLCYEKLGEYDKSLGDADTALCLYPNWSKGLYRRAQALIGLQRYKEAAFTYNKLYKEGGLDCKQSEDASLSDDTSSAEEGLVTKGRMKPSGNDTEPQSQPMTSDTANPRVPQPAAPSSLERFPVWVGNLVPSVTRQMIHKLFSDAGKIHSIKLLQDKKCAFVNYQHKDDSQKAIDTFNGRVLQGSALVVRYRDKVTVPPEKLEQECYFWRTFGCINQEKCVFKHIPEHKGIDQKKTERGSSPQQML